MSWGSRWLIDSREKWERILRALAESSIDFERHHAELIFRDERVEKPDWARRLFHAICADLAPHWGISPAAVKARVKENFYGAEVLIGEGKLTADEVIELKRLLDKIGFYEVVVRSSEDSDADEYRRLTDHAILMAADDGVLIPDRRKR